MIEHNVYHDCDATGCDGGNLRHCCLHKGCYMETIWDWSPYNECFGDSGIRISDLDGIVERNGHFLFLDGKRINGRGERNYSRGQYKLYRQLALFGCTVIVFHGEPPRDVRYVRQWLPGGEFVPEQECDVIALQTLISEWFAVAERDAA